MILKVCGLTDNSSGRAIAALPEVTHLGFIFYEKSPRFTTSSFNTEKRKVGVFVDHELNHILDLVAEHRLTGIQLHGNESPDLIARLPKKLEIFKAIGMETAADLEKTKAFEGTIDAFLFDTKSSKFGGTGTTFNWSILNHYNGTTPFILSGGIGLENIGELKNFQHPSFHGVDLNSRFERLPKEKRTEDIKQFIQHIQ